MGAHRAACGLAGLLGLLGGCGGGSGTSQAPERLPDLVQTPPRAVSVMRHQGRERLVFLSAVENEGAGPLLVAGGRTSPRSRDMSARQIVRRDDGSRASYALRATLRFVVSETHRHWHLLGFERYELRTLNGRVVGRDRKTGFCLGDRYDAHASRRLPGEPARAAWTQECGRGQPDRLRILEGLSPGFGDDYVPLLEGQYVDVTGVPAGRYVLVHQVNPDRDLHESDYANNAASVLLDLRRGADGRARARILASCPGTPRCA
jgi:hypothetical protein